MRLSAVIHLVRAARALTACQRVDVLGSGALLAVFPQLGDAGAPLELTQDADLLIEPCDDDIAAMLHEAIGEGSLFERQHGYHADILRPAIATRLAAGWQARRVEVPGAEAWALAPVDVAAAKLRVGRDKDLQVCAFLLRQRLVAIADVQAALREMTLGERELVPVLARLRAAAGLLA
jgi:hypothetical protein